MQDEDHEFDILISNPNMWIRDKPGNTRFSGSVLFTQPALQMLTATPSTHPATCVSISLMLLETLATFLPKAPSLVLSVGAGTGYLEAQLLHHYQDITLIAVEVSSDIVTYLPPSLIGISGGTWALSSVAGEAKAWMFVYPRQPALLRKYFETYGAYKGKIKVVIWLGPRCDWEDYEEVGKNLERNWLAKEVINAGCAEWEMMVAWRLGQGEIETSV